MNDKPTLDTNILIYAFGHQDENLSLNLSNLQILKS